jgi:hypothetical protein
MPCHFFIVAKRLVTLEEPEKLDGQAVVGKSDILGCGNYQSVPHMPLKPSQIEFTRAEQRGVFIATPECLMEPRSYVLTGVAADGASLGIVHIHPLRRLLAILLALAESPFPHQTRR